MGSPTDIHSESQSMAGEQFLAMLHLKVWERLKILEQTYSKGGSDEPLVKPQQTTNHICCSD
jgi:hypothetical protein